MMVFIQTYFSLQAPPPPEKEGLPYWIFWLLICIILLLVAFIFLRDKELRQRLSYFLFGAKRRMLLLRLQARFKKQNAKIRNLFRDLGKKAWDGGLRPEKSGNLCAGIKLLEEKRSSFLKESEEIEAQLSKLAEVREQLAQSLKTQIQSQESLKKPLQDKNRELNQKTPSLPEIRRDLEQEKKRIQTEIETVNLALKDVKEKGRAQARKFDRERAQWDRNKGKLKVEIKDVEGRLNPLYEALGKDLNEVKVDHPDLAVFYSQIDQCRATIEDLQRQMEKLHHPPV